MLSICYARENITSLIKDWKFGFNMLRMHLRLIFYPDNHNIIQLQPHFFLRQHRQIVTQHQKYLDILFFFHLFNGFSGIPFIDENLGDFLNIRVLHAGQTAFALILFDETGADDTGWDGNGTDAEVGDADRHRAPKCRDRVNIAVADGQQRGHTPPDTAERIVEDVRLGVVFDTIHTQAARQHQHHDDEDGGNDLVPFFVEYGGDDVE